MKLSDLQQRWVSKQVLQWGVACLLLLLLSGCSQRNPCDRYVGAARDLCLLRSHDVPVLRAGQTVKIVLPSEKLFVNDTAEFSENYQPILSTVADFMRSFSKITVKVVGYSNPNPLAIKTKTGSMDAALTQAQAQAVAHYLWCHNINARLLYAVGKNGHDPVAWAGSPVGRLLNRRVVIIFRYYLDNTAWY